MSRVYYGQSGYCGCSMSENTDNENARWCEIVTPDGTHRIDEEEWPVAVMVARERGII